MSSRNVRRLGALVIVAAAVVAVTIAIAAPRDDAKPATSAPSLFADIPQDGTSLGAPDAPATRG
jgi:hypothetical protein